MLRSSQQCGLAKFTLGRLVELALFQFTSFPRLDDSLAVEYEYQGDQSVRCAFYCAFLLSG